MLYYSRWLASLLICTTIRPASSPSVDTVCLTDLIASMPPIFLSLLSVGLGYGLSALEPRPTTLRTRGPSVAREAAVMPSPGSMTVHIIVPIDSPNVLVPGIVGMMTPIRTMEASPPTVPRTYNKQTLTFCLRGSWRLTTAMTDRVAKIRSLKAVQTAQAISEANHCDSCPKSAEHRGRPGQKFSHNWHGRAKVNPMFRNPKMAAIASVPQMTYFDIAWALNIR